MKITRSQLRQIIREVLREQYEKETPKEKKADLEKDKQELEKQKTDLKQQKLDFQKNKLDFQQDKEAEQEEEPEQSDETGEQEKQPEPNISFKTQGEFYTESMPELKNLEIGGEMADEDEKHFIALAIQASEGRFDKGFEKYLRKGYAGNVYGKDFSDKEIKSIINYVREHELVR